ncbi:hypothetical protein FUAX_55770 (plasmid) [Fulvitalea axinellae]|uniref:Uncharacterized protein n=1 Tax=Fulvitalea axinellae TaxID=1182444 RepID=A0AAU9CVU1_9BACT|nr:hypothetical protein FUAX_55770 [Fulvitalea axinellae]
MSETKENTKELTPEEMKAKIIQLEKEKGNALKTVENLTKAAEESVKDEAGKYPVFTFAKKKYELVIPKAKHTFKGKAIIVDKASLTSEKGLLGDLISIGYAGLKEVK